MKNLKKVLALVLAVVMIMGVVTVASAKTYTGCRCQGVPTTTPMPSTLCPA